MSFLYLAGSSANKINAATVSVTNENSLFPKENLQNDIPGIPFKFSSAGTPRNITADLGSATSCSFSSFHGHNLDAGVTSVKLRASTDNFSASDVEIATFTTASYATPAYFVSFSGTSYRYWRLAFTGASTNPLSIGGWVLGTSGSLTRKQLWGFNIGFIQPQLRHRSAAGQIYATNRTILRNRTLALEFAALSEAEKDEVLNSFLEASAWGAEPVIVVPDSSDEIVIHGRVTNHWDYTRRRAKGSGIYDYGLTIEEDPFEMEFQ